MVNGINVRVLGFLNRFCVLVAFIFFGMGIMSD